MAPARWRAVVVALAILLVASRVEATAGVVVGREATVRSADGLNIRAQPGPGGALLGVAADGDFVAVLAGPESDGQTDWYRVEHDGLVGWAAGAFLAPPRDQAAVSSRGALRASLSATEVRLPVPYRSQFDGSAYAAGNCGPATLGMILAAFGQDVATAEFRRIANRLQGTTGVYDAGVAIDLLADLAAQHGLTVRGLRANGGYDRWSFDEVRRALRNGNLVVPQVHYASLPGHERGNRAIDHYVVITGYEGDRFVYNDSAFEGAAGQGLTISEAALALAWQRSDYPFAAFSVGPGPGVAPLIEPPAAPAPAPAAGRAAAAAAGESRPPVAGAPDPADPASAAPPSASVPAEAPAGWPDAPVPGSPGPSAGDPTEHRPPPDPVAEPADPQPLVAETLGAPAPGAAGAPTTTAGTAVPVRESWWPALVAGALALLGARGQLRRSPRPWREHRLPRPAFRVPGRRLSSDGGAGDPEGPIGLRRPLGAR